MFVTLEPCAHFGKTPPCSDLIIKNKIPKVVIGITDSNELVDGAGIKKLKAAGIEIIQNVLKKECYDSNKRFFIFHKNKRPFVRLKWAQTKDGFIDKIRKPNEKGVNWITKPSTKKIVHQWRSEEMGIFVGTNTVRIDNPSLTVREVEGKNPTRIILDRNLSLDKALKVFNQEATTIVFNTVEENVQDNLIYKKVAFENLIPGVLKTLYGMKVQSILVEGGSRLLSSFIDLNLWDEANVIVGDVEYKTGLKAPVFQGEIKSLSENDGDKIYHYIAD